VLIIKLICTVTAMNNEIWPSEEFYKILGYEATWDLGGRWFSRDFGGEACVCISNGNQDYPTRNALAVTVYDAGGSVASFELAMQESFQAENHVTHELILTNLIGLAQSLVVKSNPE